MLPIVIALVIIIATTAFYFYTQVQGIKARVNNIEVALSKFNAALPPPSNVIMNTGGSSSVLPALAAPTPAVAPIMSTRPGNQIQMALPQKSPTPTMNVDVEQLNFSQIQKAMENGNYMMIQKDENCDDDVVDDMSENEYGQMLLQKSVDLKEFDHDGDDNPMTTSTFVVNIGMGNAEDMASAAVAAAFMSIAKNGGERHHDQKDDVFQTSGAKIEQLDDNITTMTGDHNDEEDMSSSLQSEDEITENGLKNMNLHDLKELSKKYGLKMNPKWKKLDYVKEIWLAVQNSRKMKNMDRVIDDDMEIVDDGGVFEISENGIIDLDSI